MWMILIAVGVITSEIAKEISIGHNFDAYRIALSLVAMFLSGAFFENKFHKEQ